MFRSTVAGNRSASRLRANVFFSPFFFFSGSRLQDTVVAQYNSGYTINMKLVISARHGTFRRRVHVWTFPPCTIIIRELSKSNIPYIVYVYICINPMIYDQGWASSPAVAINIRNRRDPSKGCTIRERSFPADRLVLLLFFFSLKRKTETYLAGAEE